VYCLAFSEPDHGSDLAAVETRADVLGNEFVVTGLKTWVAGADRASAALVLCRTATNELSCVLVPLHDNHVELRPIRTLSGDNALFEVEFDGARAPLSNLVGDGLEVNWRPWPESEREFWDLVDAARRNGRNHDPHIRQQLAWAYAQVCVIRVLAERDASLARVVWSEYHRRLGEIAMDVMGADGIVRPDGEAYATSRWQHVFLTSRGDTVAAGTSEIQRNTIAERVLGLPK
jgi:alkylation response protein AidB-like acyl-CoA dehydrogenase